LVYFACTYKVNKEFEMQPSLKGAKAPAKVPVAGAVAKKALKDYVVWNLL